MKEKTIRKIINLKKYISFRTALENIEENKMQNSLFMLPMTNLNKINNYEKNEFFKKYSFISLFFANAERLNTIS